MQAAKVPTGPASQQRRAVTRTFRRPPRHDGPNTLLPARSAPRRRPPRARYQVRCGSALTYAGIDRACHVCCDRPARPTALACSSEELIWAYLQRLRDLGEHRDGRIAHPAFDPADISAMQLCFERQLLLRETARLPQASNVETHLPPNLHIVDQAAVQTIVLQPMSLILLACQASSAP